ncbi:glycosyltransferase family A protein [Ferroplasma sp.]|uniref:glycosyltransferase family A protein n=1 Tax=Ferroplasma sp. TaxID=2591003 RepID=UPI00307F9455
MRNHILMLYIYGTVYNNETRIEQSIESLNKINTEKKFLIVDNFSTDRTYEILLKLANKYPIEVKQAKSTRGSGRNIAMNMAFDESNDNDLFMVFDLDTIYLEPFIKLAEKYIKTLQRNEVFLSFLCYRQTNFTVPWRDLNGAEDFERMAHFISEGYKLYMEKFQYDKYLFDNEPVNFDDREKRYAKGLNYYKRRFSQVMDIMRSLGINNIKNLTAYMKDVKVRKRFYLYGLVIYATMKIKRREIYNYSQEINLFYVRKNVEWLDLSYLNPE